MCIINSTEFIGTWELLKWDGMEIGLECGDQSMSFGIKVCVLDQSISVGDQSMSVGIRV